MDEIALTFHKNAFWLQPDSEPKKIHREQNNVKIPVRSLKTVLHPLIVWSACSVIKVKLQARAGAVFTIYVI